MLDFALVYLEDQLSSFNVSACIFLAVIFAMVMAVTIALARQPNSRKRLSFKVSTHGFSWVKPLYPGHDYCSCHYLNMNDITDTNLLLPLVRLRTHSLLFVFLFNQVPFVPVIPLLSVTINFYLMMKLSIATWVRFAIWMTIGEYFALSLSLSLLSFFLSEDENLCHHCHR